MKKFFVIGEKASKSLSPTIFNHWFKKYNIKAKYGFIEIRKKNFNQKISKILSQDKVTGINVTIPFKKNIIPHLHNIDRNSKNIKAVNCIKFNNKKTKGFNTDWAGYGMCLEKIKLRKNKPILIIGYGGASKAIIYYLKKNKFNNITVFNRSKKLLENHNKKTYTKKIKNIEKKLVGAGLIINTTPTNMFNKSLSKKVPKETIISDIVYSPKQTVFLKHFETQKKIFGIDMLINQAVLSFKEWFGFCPAVDKILKQKLEKKIK
tara:strand:- start:7408 stop:8196 length:789 start_codon:yes stop_codon:yes gene_type:complete